MRTTTNRKEPLRTTLLAAGMGLFLAACGITTANVVIGTCTKAYSSAITPLLMLTMMLFAAGGLWLKKKLASAGESALEKAARIAVPVYLAVLFALHLLLGYLMEYTPMGDNFMLFRSSQMLVTDGNFDAYPDFYLYLSRFSNQWGFLLMLSALYRLLFAIGLTDMFFPTVVVQALLYTGGMTAYFAIARRLRGVRGVLAALFAAVTCLPLYLAAAVLYTDTFSLPLLMLCALFALRTLDSVSIRQTLFNALLCALFGAVGGQIKMTVAILLIAATIVFFLRLPALRACCACAVLWLVMGLSVFVVNKAMVGPVLDPEMVAQHNTPTIHWVMMSIPNGNNPSGSYNSADYALTWGMMEEGASREEVLASIYTRLKDKIYFLRYPSRLIPFMLMKNASAFGDGTFYMTDMLDDTPKRENVISSFALQDGEHYPAYFSICTGIYFVHLIFAALMCLQDVRRRDFRCALLYIALLGLILFMLLWEARSRYIFNFVPVLLILSSSFMSSAGEERGKRIG